MVKHLGGKAAGEERVCVGLPDTNLVRTIPELIQNQAAQGADVQTLLGRQYRVLEPIQSSILVYMS